MQVVRPPDAAVRLSWRWTLGDFTEEYPARDAELAAALVSRLYERSDRQHHAVLALHRDQDIDDRLGSEAGHGCAANVLDVSDPVSDDGDDAIALFAVEDRPATGVF